MAIDLTPEQEFEADLDYWLLTLCREARRKPIRSHKALVEKWKAFAPKTLHDGAVMQTKVDKSLHEGDEAIPYKTGEMQLAFDKMVGENVFGFKPQYQWNGRPLRDPETGAINASHPDAFDEINNDL